MKNFLIRMSIFAFLIIILIGCSDEVPKEFDLKQLHRVDVQILTGENSDNERIITEEEKINTLRKVFAGIEWEQNVKAETDRKEDVKATLFFRYDKNLPERLFEYFIWFNQGNASATIIDREKNSLGTVDNEDAQTLKEVLVHD
jgi:hypothetical protein